MATAARPLVWLFSLAGTKQVPLHDLGDLVVEDRLADLETLTYSIRAVDPKRSFVVADQIVEYAGRRYRTEEIHEFREGASTIVEVRAESLWLDLGKIAHAGSATYYGKTAADGLTAILTDSGWTSAGAPVDGNLYSIDAVDASTLGLLRTWSTVTGYELLFDTVAKTVELVTQLGVSRGIGFRWGHNLRNIERRYRPPIATRQYAFGANNLSIADPNPLGLPYVEDYSWYTGQGLTLAQAKAQFRKDDIWVDERYLAAVNLYDAAVRRLALLAQPTIAYELTVADLAELTATPLDDVSIGDTVRVRDQDFSVDLTTRVVRVVRRPLNPQANELELNYLRPGLIGAEPSTTTRSVDYGQLGVIVDKKATDLTIGGGVTAWSELTVTTTGEATAILGGTFQGVATGTGTIQIWATLDGVDVGARRSIVFTAGQEIEHSWPTFETGLGEGSHTFKFRATISAGTGTVLATANMSRGWMLVRGGVGIGFDTSASQYIAEELDVIVGFPDALAATVTTAVTTPGGVDVSTIAVTDTLSTVADPTALTDAWTVTLI